MTKNKTELALMARGIGSEQARALRLGKWTLAKLSKADLPTLKLLELTSEVIDSIRSGQRPPIPTETLINVLYANRWVCCVCRDTSRPVIVHHINSWAQSRDHSASNLAVLCTVHHGEAHTTHGLEMTLSAERLLQLKNIWETNVAGMDALAIQQATQLQSDTWLYFNHTRLFEIAVSNGISLREIIGYSNAFLHKVCDSDGNVIKTAAPGSFMYADSDGRQLYRYVKATLYAMLDSAQVVNISDDLDRGTLRALITSGDLIYVQGLHIFSTLTPAPGSVDLVRGTRSANGVEVTFDFDRREASSVSAWSLWLRGSQNVGSLIHVKNVERLGKNLKITGTVIAVRTALSELKKRTYEAGLYRSGLIGHFDEDEDEDWQDLDILE